MTRFWASWIQPGEDYRPLNDPPNENILGWWCSGYAEGGATLCAVVTGTDEDSVRSAISVDWPEINANAIPFRFCEERPDDYQPGTRFPLNDWMKQRFKR